MEAFGKSRLALGALMGLLAIMGCPRSAPLPYYGPLRTEVERLYLNYHELRTVHSDLRSAARLHIEREGGQLGEIQSAARLIDQANLIAYYQWELLSITEYIREGARGDFFTLRVKDIADARRKSKDLMLAIKVYDAFIKDPMALALIAKGVRHIEQHVEVYETLYGLMLPMANRPATAPGVQEQEFL